MKDKLIAFFDNKVVWLTIGSVAGSVFGADVAGKVNALGAFVMAVL